MDRPVRRPHLALLLLGSLFLAGCKTALWLPDSDRLIYTDGRTGAFHEIDLKESTVRAIKAGEASHTLLPGVNVDGTRLARLYILDGSHIQIKIFDREGGAVHVSPKFEWPGKLSKKGSEPNINSLLWAPDDDHLLFDIWSGPRSQTGSYSQKTKKFRVHEQYWASPLQHGYVMSLIPPESDGFFAFRPTSPPSLHFVEWNGNAQRVTLSKAAQKRFPWPHPGQGPKAPLPLHGGWKMRVGEFPVGDGYLVIDPQARKVTFREDQRLKGLFDALDRSKFESMAVLRGGEAIVAVRKEKGSNIRDIIHYDTETGKQRKLLASAGDFVGLFPSPDGENVAVQYGKGMIRMAVIDAAGKFRFRDGKFAP